jgi:hypothetical protein
LPLEEAARRNERVEEVDEVIAFTTKKKQT